MFTVLGYRSAMKFELTRELTSQGLGQLACPTGAWHRDLGSMDVIASRLSYGQWAGRSLPAGERATHRLSVFSNDLSERIAVFDGARYPVNDVAIHPTRSVMAIGTGSYDGGYMFEGELLLWNWETSEVRALFPYKREVVRCRWEGDGGLVALLRPETEEDFDGVDDEPFDSEVCVSLIVGGVFQKQTPLRGLLTRAKHPTTLDLDDSQPCDPRALGFEDGGDPTDANLARVRALLGPTDWEERGLVWDLCWTGSHELAATTEQCWLETWDTLGGDRLIHVVGEGHGVELIATGGHLLVNVVSNVKPRTSRPSHRSKLLRLAGSSLEAWRSFDYPVAVSCNSSGALLCRDVSQGASSDEPRSLALGPSGDVLFQARLGAYDLFNHYLRIDGSEAHYFLRGKAGAAHQEKRLMRFEGSGKSKAVCDWDGPNAQLMHATACAVDDSAMVRAYADWSRGGACCLERIELQRGGSSTWKVELSAPVTALAVDGDRVFYAQADGQLSVRGVADGKVHGQTELTVDGVSSVATSLAMGERELAVGTLDGRILLFSVE